MASKKTSKKATKSTTRKSTKTKAKARAKATTRPAARPTKRPKAPPKRAPQDGLTLRAASPSFTVDDVEKSLRWYRDVMGFAAGERWEEKGKLMGTELKAGPITFMIGQDDWNKGRDRVKGGGFRLYCQTEQDVDGLAERIKARGGSLLQEPRDEEWGGRAFTVQDPDGFKITIARTVKGK